MTSANASRFHIHPREDSTRNTCACLWTMLLSQLPARGDIYLYRTRTAQWLRHSCDVRDLVGLSSIYKQFPSLTRINFMKQNHSEKPTVCQPVKKFCSLCDLQDFLLCSQEPANKPCLELIQSGPKHRKNVYTILPSTSMSPTRRLPTKIVYALLISDKCHN
jgi:hypothetical protein